MIDYSTKLLGLIGEKINYTISPQIHNLFYQLEGINAVYLVFDIKRKKVSNIFHVLIEITHGLNMGIPYKVFLSRQLPLSKEAEVSGAINTVFKSKGFNTDYLAFKSLVNEKIDKVSNCLVFGAGGAARASIYALSELGCDVFVINLFKEEVLELESHFSKFDIKVKHVNSRVNLNYDVLVNATPDPGAGGEGGLQVRDLGREVREAEGRKEGGPLNRVGTH